MKYLSKTFYLQLCVCILFSLSAASCSKKGQEPKVKPSSAENEVVAETTLLATVEPQNNINASDITVYFNEYGRGAAYASKSGDTFRVIYNGKPSGPLEMIDTLILSPDGKHMAYSAMANGKWRMFIDGTEGVQSDEVSAAAFSPDSRHIAYAAKIDGKWHMVVDSHVDSSGWDHISTPIFSADSQKIVYSEKIENQGYFQLVISDLANNRLFVKESCGSDFIINREKTVIAAIMETGKKQSVVQLSFDRPDSLKQGASFGSVSNIVFGSDGASVAYLGVRGEKRFLVVNGREDILPAGNMPQPPVLRSDLKGAGILISSDRGFFLHQAFVNDSIKEKKYEEASALVYSRDGSLHAYTARKGDNWFVVLNGHEGPGFDRVVTPIFSPDNSRLIYRARKDGKRFVVVADANGKTINQHPSYEQVFQPVFTADGESIAYGVKDSNKLIWKVERLD